MVYHNHIYQERRPRGKGEFALPNPKPASHSDFTVDEMERQAAAAMHAKEAKKAKKKNSKKKPTPKKHVADPKPAKKKKGEKRIADVEVAAEAPKKAKKKKKRVADKEVVAVAPKKAKKKKKRRANEVAAEALEDVSTEDYTFLVHNGVRIHEDDEKRPYEGLSVDTVGIPVVFGRDFKQ